MHLIFSLNDRSNTMPTQGFVSNMLDSCLTYCPKREWIKYIRFHSSSLNCNREVHFTLCNCWEINNNSLELTSWAFDFNINQSISNLGFIVNLVMKFLDCPCESTCNSNWSFITLHLANLIKLINCVSDFNVPE